MKPKPFLYLFFILFSSIMAISSCNDIIEPSISKKQVILEVPADQYQSSSYTINFWWDEVENALSYHLQVVTPNFISPGNLVLDTIVTKKKISFTLSPGNYQWRVMAENGSSGTVYTAPKNFSVNASSIKQQTVQLNAPANSFLTNQGTVTFRWGSLYGATQYRFEIDTNNFANESAILVNSVIPGLQINFMFAKDQVYQWRVRAENDTAQALWSAINVVTYDHTPPAQVSVTSPTDSAVVKQPVSLQWKAVNFAAKYKVYLYKSDGTTLFNPSFPLTLTATSYSFNMGTSGDKFFWKVSGVDAAGNEGPASSLISFTVQ